MVVRAEEERDRAGVHVVNTAAFARAAEARLVDALRQHASRSCPSLPSMTQRSSGTSCSHRSTFPPSPTARSWVSPRWRSLRNINVPALAPRSSVPVSSSAGGAGSRQSWCWGIPNTTRASASRRLPGSALVRVRSARGGLHGRRAAVRIVAWCDRYREIPSSVQRRSLNMPIPDLIVRRVATNGAAAPAATTRLIQILCRARTWTSRRAVGRRGHPPDPGDAPPP
jgi:hypothetical protein